ncbi:MAG: hypothetical protein ACREU1_04970 [Burkholderiales bacterium]
MILSLVLVACTEDQSKAIGQQPKKVIDRATSDVNKAMQQGSERLKEEQK